MNPQDLHNDLTATLATATDRDDAINAFLEAMKALEERAIHTQQDRAQAMSLGVSVKGALLRSRTDVGTLNASDGRIQDTMERQGLVKPGLDFQGSPVSMLTAEGMRQAALLKGYARALQDGVEWKDHVQRAAPSAKEHEQKALWGETFLHGAAPTGERVWSNAHVAMLWPSDEKLLPTALRGDLRDIPSRNFGRVWPQDIDQRERIEPLAVSGVLNASKASVTDAREVWFSNGSSANAAYVDAVLRAYPDAQFHADPLQARRGSIAVTVPFVGSHKVVGLFMPTSTGYLVKAMPAGVGRAIDAHWLAQGVDPRTKALERSMQEQMHAFASVNGYFNTVLRSPGSNIVMYGHWQEEPTVHPILKWDALSNLELLNLAKHTQVLSFGISTPQEVERIKGMKPMELVARWNDETTMAEIGRDGKSMAMTDGLGRRASLDSIEKVVQYRRERALPEWRGAAVLHELRYTHEAQDSQAFTPPRERDGPPLAIGTRVRWTANPPNVGCIEGLLTQCDRSQAGNWRLTIATRRFDGEPIHQRMWTNEGTVEEAGWSIERDFRFTKLTTPSGEHHLVESAQDLEDLVHGIGIEDPAMVHYADALRTQWWQSRTMAEYKDSIGQALEDGFGVSVEEGLFSDGLEFQRDMGMAPIVMAHVVGTRLQLNPLQVPALGLQGMQDSPVGLVPAEGAAWTAQPATSQGNGQRDPTATTWNLGAW